MCVCDVQRGTGRRVVGPDGQVHIRVRRTPRRSANAADARASRSDQSLVAKVTDARRPARLLSAQIMHTETAPISTPSRPPTPTPSSALPPPPPAPPAPVVETTRLPVVKQRAVRQVVNVDVGLAGAPTLPVIVPPSFIHGSQLERRNHPDTHELIALGGIDLENISGDMPGRLQCSYDNPNNSWKTLTSQLPEFIHHHGVVAIEGRLYVVGELRWLLIAYSQ